MSCRQRKYSGYNSQDVPNQRLNMITFFGEYRYQPAMICIKVPSVCGLTEETIGAVVLMHFICCHCGTQRDW